MNDIYLYGEINDGANFLQELQYTPSPVRVHINSPGGNPFGAMAIAHGLKNREGELEIIVDGICASAAVLVLCCGRKVRAMFNSLFMIHEPKVLLEESCTAEELGQAKEYLDKVTEQVQKTLSTRIKNFDLSREKWYTAKEALRLGLVDEVVDAKKALDGIRAEERARLKALNSLRGTDSAINALIDVAIERDTAIEEVKAYVDAMKMHVTQNLYSSAVTDNVNSGSAGVIGSSFQNSGKEAQMQKVIKYANRRLGK